MTELEIIRRDLKQLAAGSWAMQMVLVCLLARLDNQVPGVADLLRNSLDDATNLVEQLAVMGGQDPERFAQAIKVIEELRLAVQGQGQLKHGL
jgi:hypothetical protein